MSFAQRRLWFLHRWDRDSAAYHLSAAIRLAGPLDTDALERALREVIRRHEVFRTVFLEVGGEPVQLVRDEAEFAMERKDLRELELGAREARMRELAAEEARRPFDLERGPLLRANLLRTGSQEWVLLLTIHHIVSDGWSMGILVRELGALYEAFSAGRPSPLPDLPLQYADFARWQSDRLQGEALDRQIAHWKKALSGAPAVIELPVDRPRPPARSFRGATRSLWFPPELASALDGLARGERATLFMVLLAAFQTLLHRITWQEDIVVGSPIANRNRSEIEGLIGFFVNTLVLRTDLSGDPTFRELLGRVREVAMEAYAYQDMPFERLVEELQPERDPSHTPLFQVMFALQNAPAPVLELPGLTMTPLEVEIETAKFDLALSMEEADGGLHASMTFDTDLFEPSTIVRMLGRFQALLEGIAADPDRRISHLPVMDDGERRRLLVEWNDTASPYPRERCIHDLFEVLAEKSPGAIAVVCDGAAMSYGELNRRANNLAHRLRALGAGPEERVAICLDRSAEMIVGLLGILKSGAAYVPLDPTYPRERLVVMLDDSHPCALVTERRLLAALPTEAGGARCETIFLGTDGEATRGEGEAAESDQGEKVGFATPDNLAYVIYTSGSTGRPKGVTVTHRSVVRLVLGTSYIRFEPEEVFLQLAPISFDASVFEIWGCLLNGGRLVVMPPGAPSLQELGRAVRRHGVTTLWLTASLFHLMVDEQIDSLRGVRQLLAGGDVLSPGHVRKAFEELEGCRLVNGYGPTEGTTFTCCHEVRGEERERRSVPIGRPIANTRAYVLDGRLQPAPIGVPGELCIGGDGLARGYLALPAATAEMFLPDPFSSRPGERMYRTGDLARVLPDGAIEFLGRRDHQVKLRGFRIELGEIEVAIAEHPDVREATVVARDEASGDRRLTAYVSGRGGTLEAGELRRFLRERLPEYMVPSEFVSIAALPLTPSGKVDRLALPGPGGGESCPAGLSAAPRTPIEEVVAGMWAQLLRLERVGMEESFFDLGGHSLLATQAVSRVREAFGVEISLRKLFERPTVSGFSEEIERALRSEEGMDVGPIHRASRTGELPLSFAQERLWFLQQLEPENPYYNIPAGLRLLGRLDPAALQRSFEEILRRHEALRTIFPVVEGRPVQSVAEPRAFDLPVADLRSGEQQEREAEAGRQAREEALAPFDLERGLPFRARLLRLCEEDHLLLVTMHHIVSDGWSLGVLVRELAALYEAFSAGRSSPLADLPVQYVDFAAWQRQWLAGKKLRGQLAYWTRQLAGASVLDLPTDRPRRAIQTTRGAQASLCLSADLSARLADVGRREGATLFMTLLAAFQTLLHRYSGQTDILVGTPIANRNRAEIEGLIGFFVNTLVLRTDFSGEPTFRQLLRQVRETALGAYAHQDLPFEQLVEALQPRRDLSHTPLFQTMFVLQNAPVDDLDLPGISLQTLRVPSETAKFDISLAMQEGEEGLEGAIEYNTDLFERETIEGMARHIVTLLRSIATDPEVRVSELEMMDEAERRLVVAGWNEPSQCELAEPGEKPEEWRPGERPGQALGSDGYGGCVHELFERQAERSASAAAVRYGGKMFRYGELNERANQLAHHLRSLGARPEERVGVFLERSPDTVVGMLAVLKAGGVYVPLDRQCPRERLEVILEDAGVSLVVTRQSLAQIFPPRAGSCRVVRLDADEEVLSRASRANPRSGALSGNAAYVIYTSGTTGSPKGVCVSHATACEHFAAVQNCYELEPADQVLQLGSLSFDASLEQILPTLLCGATVVLAEESVWGAAEFLGKIEELRITVLNLPTAYWHQLAQELSTEEALPSRMPAWLPRLVVVGGETMLPEALRLWRGGPLGGVKLLNCYGPTEATITATVHDVPHDAGEWRVPIGRPLGNRRAYILQPNGLPVPVGVPGELYLGGALARGYLGLPEATAENFLPDPFSDRPGERLYRTGDLVRWRPDATIEFLGRLDHQVKVSGFRVEPEEIESALCRHPDVLEAVAIAREDSPGDRRLVAYVVPRRGRTLAPVDLRAFLKEKLPEYMVPSAFVPLAALPITAGGKVDRRALPAPPRTGIASGAGSRAPSGPVEEVIAGIWCELLRLDRIGRHDNFFDLGGHSLLATRVVSRVRVAFGAEVPLRRLFEAPTVAGLAGIVEAAMRTRGRIQEPAIEPVPRDSELSLSFAQERLWFLDQLEPGSARYNVPIAVRLHGPLDVSALQRSMEEIVRRHEALRTTFPLVGGRPSQAISPAGAFDQPVLDLRGMARDEREAEALRLAGQEAERSFDLARGPLVRVLLLRLSDEDHALLVTMHHIVSDGWSMDVFVRELAALYEAYSSGRPSPLPALSVQYADYAVWQRRWLAGEALDRQLAYWKERLAGTTGVLQLPTDRPRPAVRRFRAGRQALSLRPDLVEKVRLVGRQEGATSFMTLLAAFQALLHRYSGQEDILVGTPIANRPRAEVEGLIGFFVNTLVMRADLSGDPTFRVLLRQVREAALGAYAHQDLPFERLVEALQPPRDTSLTPLFQAMFVLQSGPADVLELPELTLGPMSVPGETTKFDLTLSLVEMDGGLEGVLEYDAELFDGETITRMAGHFQRLLEEIASDPDRRVSGLPLLDEAQRRRILLDWSGDRGVSLGETQSLPCVHELFEARARADPGALAIACGGERCSYGELDERASFIARRLRDLGVGPEVRVAVCLDRSIEMVAAVLAVMKAGGAYVPLDPSHPAIRLAFLLQDCGASIVLSRARAAAKLSEARPSVTVLDPVGEMVVELRGTRRKEGRGTEDRGVKPGGCQEGWAPTPDNLAYVIYTSGSTGEPKGVEIPHAGLANLVVWHCRAQNLAPSDRLSNIAQPVFDASAWEIWPALVAGASLHIPPEEAILSPAGILRWLASERIDVSFLPTPIAEAVIDEPMPEGLSLRAMLTGGDRLRRRPPGGLPFRLFNNYGPTENTVVTTWTLVRPEEGPAGPPSIGRPVSGVHVYLLDGGGEPVSAGIPGELHVGGAGLARGYLGRPDLTAERFLPDPFGGESGGRLYRTGDLARWRADGTIEFLGRLDQQVKIRGVRIEPGEIEGALRLHPGVRDAVVVAREEISGDRRLVAYIVATPAPPPSCGSLREFLRGLLPASLVPAEFVALDAFPLTPAGKVDRRALTVAPRRTGDRPDTFVPPATADQRLLADAWARALGVERVGLHDGFFDLGGHSLMAALLIAEVRAASGVDLPLRALFDAPTVAGMAEALAVARHAGPAAATRDGVPATAARRPRGERLDLTAEAALDPEIRPLAPAPRLDGAPGLIFLTGATGFLGAFLLHELLVRTSAVVCCLVRCPDPGEGRSRLRGAMETYGLWDHRFWRRIEAVPGDLGRPLLGLPKERFEALAAGLDTIYHNGASVNFLYPYQMLKAANVEGTREVLRLACAVRAKPLHYVSTLSVFASTTYAGRERLLEDDEPVACEGIESGYAQSKWVAERLVSAARARGLPAVIYRPGRIAGSGRTGAAPLDDLTSRYIKGCVQMGLAPESDGELDLTPVDYVAAAIVHLSLREGSLGKVFHLANPHPIPFDEMVGCLAACGYPLHRVPYERWLEELSRAAGRPGGNALSPLLPLFEEEEEEGSERMRETSTRRPVELFDCRRALEELAGSGIVCPPADAELVRVYLSFFAGCGFLPPPLTEGTEKALPRLDPQLTRAEGLSIREEAP